MHDPNDNANILRLINSWQHVSKAETHLRLRNKMIQSILLFIYPNHLFSVKVLNGAIRSIEKKGNNAFPWVNLLARIKLKESLEQIGHCVR